MTRIKLCGLMKSADIETANRLGPDYIGFVFATKSRRYVDPDRAARLKSLLRPDIRAVGVFVNENLNTVAALLKRGIIDIAQLHGSEDENYIQKLREISGRPIIRAFQISDEEDVNRAVESPADYILLDSGAGSGRSFDWSLLADIRRPYFLAGGLDPDNVSDAVLRLKPFAVDVSSGIESAGSKDPVKMESFVKKVRLTG